MGNGSGKWEASPHVNSGFISGKDARGLALLYGAEGKPIILAVNNDDVLSVFTGTKVWDRLASFKQGEQYCEIQYEDGRLLRKEHYKGSGYLSQSTRKFRVPKNAKRLVYYNNSGQKTREIKAGSRSDL